MPVRVGTPEWLEARLEGVTSSDAAVLAGEKGSVVELYALKRRLAPAPEFDAPTARLLEWGQRLEDVIADWYTDETGRPVRRVNRLMQRRDDRWMRTSLDRESGRKGERIVVELKATRWKPRRAGEEVPGDVYAQAMWQLWVMDYDESHVVTLVGGNEPLLDKLPRNDKYIDDLVYIARDFRDHVERGVAPPVDGSEATRRALARMYAEENGVMLAATAQTDELARQWVEAELAYKAAKDTRGTVRNAMRAMIGDATGVLRPDSYRFTWKRNKPSVDVHWAKIAADLRARLESHWLVRVDAGEWSRADYDELVADVDALIVKHSETKDGARVLRPRFFKPADEAAAEEQAEVEAEGEAAA
jgi:putative phage-type endonuclease